MSYETAQSYAILIIRQPYVDVEYKSDICTGGVNYLAAIGCNLQVYLGIYLISFSTHL